MRMASPAGAAAVAAWPPLGAPSAGLGPDFLHAAVRTTQRTRTRREERIPRRKRLFATEFKRELAPTSAGRTEPGVAGVRILCMIAALTLLARWLPLQAPHIGRRSDRDGDGPHLLRVERSVPAPRHGAGLLRPLPVDQSTANPPWLTRAQATLESIVTRFADGSGLGFTSVGPAPGAGRLRAAGAARGGERSAGPPRQPALPRHRPDRGQGGRRSRPAQFGRTQPAPPPFPRLPRAALFVCRQNACSLPIYGADKLTHAVGG